MQLNLAHLLQALRIASAECASLLGDEITTAPSLADVIELREALKKHQVLMVHAAQVVEERMKMSTGWVVG